MIITRPVNIKINPNAFMQAPDLVRIFAEWVNKEGTQGMVSIIHSDVPLDVILYAIEKIIVASQEEE